MDRSEHIKNLFLHTYEESADAIYRFCFFRVSDKELAEDLVQETFTRSWLYISEGKEVQNMRAFLYQTARNLIIDHFRKKKSGSLDALVDEGVQFEELDMSDSEEHMVDVRYTFEKIQPLLNKLDDTYREVLILRYVEDLGPKEISALLGESENVISVRINRAMTKLRTLAATYTDI